MALSLLFPSLLLIAVHQSNAIIASPIPFNVTTSSGKSVPLFLNGGERFRWLSDSPQGVDSFTVLRENGTFFYARLLADGNIGATSFEAGEVDPEEQGLEPSVIPSEERRKEKCEELGHLCSEPNEPNKAAQTGRSLQTAVQGKVKNLVIPMIWSDHVDRTLPTLQDLDVLFNSEGGDPDLAPTGSLRDVYIANSYGVLEITSTIYPWVTLDNTEVFYADGNSGNTKLIFQALKFALDQLEADPNFDFAQFDEDGDGYIDAITFLHSGYGAEWSGTDVDGTYWEDRIWSHKWNISPEWESESTGVKVSPYHISTALWGLSGSEIGRVAVIAHETAHFFGLPDLYDSLVYGSGLGCWCLMANSWGFDNSQLYPPQLSAWSRVQLGWDTETVIEESGTYTISASEPLTANHPRIYRIDINYPDGEYLLIENRQALGFDKNIPQGGLAIWHIDSKQILFQDRQGFPGQPTEVPWPENGNHYAIALLQPDGNYDLERKKTRGNRGDIYHGDGVDSIGPSNNTATGPFPNTDAYQSGNVMQTDNRIFDISVVGNEMTFKYSNSDTPGTQPPGPSTSRGAMHEMHSAAVAFGVSLAYLMHLLV